MAWNRHAIAQTQLRKHVASMACGARNLTSTRLWCCASLGCESVRVPVTPVPVSTHEQRAITAERASLYGVCVAASAWEWAVKLALCGDARGLKLVCLKH